MKKSSVLLFRITLVTCLLFASPSMAQQKDSSKQAKSKPDTTRQVYEFVEDMPSFPGGNAAMAPFLSKNIKWPPEFDGSGSVYISFIVENDGSLTGINVRKNSTGDERCAIEAKRVVGLMPKWTPGKINGVPVAVRFAVPLKFYMH